MVAVRHVIIADPDGNERARLAEVVLAVGKELGNSIRVHQTGDGKGVLAFLADHRAALIVCEVLLEGMSGLMLLRSLRDQGDGVHTPPVIFVTTMARESDRFWGLRNGAHSYIAKPYDPDQLSDRVRAVLAGKDEPD